jgi:NADH:ubiquinone oxidoreductase subunit 5 (subunit L)/multisubunit Na+/H+ antiporter MnhA subunit
LLSGVILKAGAFGIIRVVFNVFGVNLMRDLGVFIAMAILACITIVVASVFALTQDNLKRRLAYSSIGQVSYIILGLAMLSQDGALGGVMHLTHHALMKGCLFLCAGVVLVKTGIKNISEMKGIGYKIPITMICFSVCALAMMGTPPSVGFITKWLLGSGSLEAGLPVYIAILLTSALLNAAYFLPIIYIAFFQWEEGEEKPKLHLGKEADHKLVVPVVILAALVIIVGVWVTVPGFPYSLANPVVEEIYEGSISGYVRVEAGAAEAHAEGELAPEGIEVRLLREGAGVATTLTDREGYYLFEKVRPGSYEVAIVAAEEGHGEEEEMVTREVELKPGGKAEAPELVVEPEHGEEPGEAHGEEPSGHAPEGESQEHAPAGSGTH